MVLWAGHRHSCDCQGGLQLISPNQSTFFSQIGESHRLSLEDSCLGAACNNLKACANAYPACDGQGGGMGPGKAISATACPLQLHPHRRSGNVTLRRVHSFAPICTPPHTPCLCRFACTHPPPFTRQPWQGGHPERAGLQLHAW